MLVCTFAGRELVLRACKEAVREGLPVLQLWGWDGGVITRNLARLTGQPFQPYTPVGMLSYGHAA